MTEFLVLDMSTKRRIRKINFRKTWKIMKIKREDMGNWEGWG
jgi:hypothetical protein